MIRIAARLLFTATLAVPVTALLLPEEGHAQSRPWQGGVESTPLAPPPGFGSPTLPPAGLPAAPEPRRPQAQRPPVPAQVPGQAQGQTQPQSQPAVPPPPVVDTDEDGVVVQLPAQKIANAFATFAGLDKITGRITSFDVAIGETAQFGALQVTPRVCYTRPANETQNTTSFAEVNEMTLKGEAKRIFTGWMFAASPGLHGVEHPIYDVWLIGCKASAPQTARGQQ